LLEAGRDEEFIEKDTGVSDRTIRRWKMELERTGRIGKPPESRTGRHRVLNAEVETVSTTLSHALLQSVRADELMRTVAGAVRAC
jgi:transposase